MHSHSREPGFSFNRPRAWLPAIGVDHLAGGLLLLGGLFHLAWLALTGAAWEGPLSPRKPALFGISSGMTVLSLAWIVRFQTARPIDRWVSRAVALGLLVEVALITLQFWRGVPSHFNHSTALDSLIENSMLCLILLATGGIVWLAGRSRSMFPEEDARSLSIRAGLWLLVIACGLGILIAAVGAANQSAGRSPELVGPAGVLKFPHGAVLHAIQSLPLLAWLLERIGRPAALAGVRCAVAAHLAFLLYAGWQTAMGRGRADPDGVGWLFLGLSVLLFSVPVALLIGGALIGGAAARPTRQT